MMNLNSIRRIGFTVAVAMGTVGCAVAQNADDVLKKTVSTLKSAKAATISYAYQAGGDVGNGTISIKGKKFVNKMPGQTVWFNGKTMWTLVKANEEVNVTTPTAAQAAAMNPYGFLSLYKNGYAAKMTSSTKTEFVVTLTPKGKDKQTVTLHINRMSYLPSSVKMKHASAGNVAITVKSFKKHPTLSDGLFSFNPKAFPQYEVIDLR